MKDWKNIIWFLLLLSTHLSIRFFSVSYWIFYASLFLGSLTILSKKRSKINNGFLFASAAFIFISLVIHLLIQGNLYGTNLIYTLLSFWLLFFIWTVLFNQDRAKIKVITGIIIFTCIVELVLGFVQLFGWLDSYNDYFVIGGSFGNPNVYGGYLSVVSPLILSLLLTYRRNKKAENLCYILTGCLIFIIYMVVMSRSRGAWLACGLGCLFVVVHYYSLIKKIRRLFQTATRKIAAIVCIAVLVCAGGYILYQWKADSAFGRLFVWKVALSFPPYSFGNGIGCFEADYGKKQAAFFASGKGTEAEQYVADYVTCAYNDFLEIAIEQGIVIMGLFIALLYNAFRQENRTKSTFFMGAQASIASITVLMLVSYPLKIPAIYLYFIFCLAVVFHAQKGKEQMPVKWLKWSLPMIAFLIAIAGSYNIYGYNLLNKGEIFVLKGQLDKGIEAYQKAEPILENNGIFHFYYGSALFMKQEYKAAVKELELSVAKSSNPNSFILLGNSYKELGQFDRAKENYLVAINMIPSRLYPKYLLSKLLIEKGEDKEAKKWANEILNTKEKTPTTAAKEIKEEMNLLINNELSNDKTELPMEK
jgi:tetratricopeptide (TPR) repeat protein